MKTFAAIAVLLCLAVPVGVLRGQRYTILIDPARGGKEDGARINEHTSEKQVTLDVANRLRSLLSARDFDVVLTRDGDVQVSNDARATLANQAKPIACILLHATAAGKGMHLFTTSLTQAGQQGAGQTGVGQTGALPGYAVPWDEAQGPFVQRSQRLANELTTAFGRAKIAVSSGRTWIRPLDNMECPAVAVEIAPGSDGETAADRAYQTRIVDTIAGAMLFWRGHTDVVQSIVPPQPVVEPRSTEPKSSNESVTGEDARPRPIRVPAGSTTTTPGTAVPKSVPAKPASPKPAAPRPATQGTPAPGGLPE